MSKRGSRYICMFLIYIIILPVFQTANVFAEFYGGVHGYDNIDGFRKSSGDVTIINVSAGITGESILPSQVKLISDPTRPFECVEDNITKQVYCEMIVPGDLPPGPHLYEIQLFHQDSSPAGDKLPLTLYVDNLPPVISLFELVRNGSGVGASYQVSDLLCADCVPDICAGIDRVEFSLNYEPVGEVMFEGGPCILQPNSTNLSIAPVPGTATKTICIDAYDRLGQKSSVCKDIVIDFSPPQLINATLWLGANQLRYTKGEPLNGVRLEVYLSEESGINMSSFVADLSALNSRPEFSSLYKNIDAGLASAPPMGFSCTNLSKGVYNCSWSGLLVILPSAAVPVVAISVDDSLGNHMNATYNIPIVFDNTPPVIDSIRSGIADERGRYWVGRGNNTIYVDITETGSGFADRKLFIDFGSFGPQQLAGGRSVLAPTNCTPGSASGWTCVFDFVNVANPHSSGDILSVNVVFGSSDDANNPVSGVTTAGFYFDNEAPQIISIQNSTVCPTFPDSIDLVVNVSERYSGGVNGEVSAPGLSTNYFPLGFECEETVTAGIWTCSISVDNLVTLYVDGELNITLEDRAGNRNTTTVRQEVCEAAPGTPPNVIRASCESIMPSSGIDRQISSVIPFPLYVRVMLQPVATSASVQQVKVNGCTSGYGTFSDSYVLDSLNFVNPLISTRATLSEEALNVSGSEPMESVDVSCEIEMIVRAGTKVYQEPEIENFTCTVPVHGTVFGGIDHSLSETLEDIDAEIKAKEDEIADYEGWLDVLGTFCTIAEFAAKLSAALQIIREVVWLVALILYHIESTRPAGRQLYYYTCLVSEWVTALTMTLLWNIDSGLTFGGIGSGGPTETLDTLTSTGFYFKILCGLFTCRLTEQNTIVELLGGMFTDWSSYGAGSYSKFVGETEVEGGRNEFPEGEEASDKIPADVYKVVFSAYRCKEMTNAFLCMPGYVFALRKERQLLCMKRNCYREFVSAGMSSEICDRMYAGRHCLYVTSAAYKVAGDEAAGRIALGVFEYIINLMTGSIFADTLRNFKQGSDNACAYPYGIWKGFVERKITGGIDRECGRDATTSSPELTDTKWSHICGLVAAVALWTDVGDWLSSDDWTDWNYYDAKLGDPDYCSM